MWNDMMKTVLGGLGVLAIAVSSACTPAPAFCTKYEECSKTPLSEDFHNVCTEGVNSGLSTIRANDEPECQDLADARTALLACVAQLECVDFDESDFNGRCKDERLAVEDFEGEEKCAWAPFPFIL